MHALDASKNHCEHSSMSGSISAKIIFNINMILMTSVIIMFMQTSCISNYKPVLNFNFADGSQEESVF